MTVVYGGWTPYAGGEVLRAPSLCFAVFVYFNCYYNSLFGKKQEFLQDYGEPKNKQKSPNKKRPPHENQPKTGDFVPLSESGCQK